MSPAQQADIDRQIEEGRPVTQGVPPDLTPRAARLTSLWSTLRSTTPGDHPVSLSSIALYVGADALHDIFPWVQIMDRAYFEAQRERTRAERAQAEKRAQAARVRRSR